MFGDILGHFYDIENISAMWSWDSHGLYLAVFINQCKMWLIGVAKEAVRREIAASDVFQESDKITAINKVINQGECKKLLKNYKLTSYVIFVQIISFSIIKLITQEKHGFYLFHYSTNLKCCVIFK